MLKYRYFLIDLDRTLWDFNKNAKRAISKLIDKYTPPLPDYYKGIKISNENAIDIFYPEYETINYALWDDYEAGKITKDQLRAKRFYDTFLLFGIDDPYISSQFDAEYLILMEQEKELVPGAIELLRYIRAKGAKIAIITNGFTAVQTNKIKNSGISEYIDILVTSEQTGIHKPSPGIFRIALERLSGQIDLAPLKRETVMIGDDFFHDIEGAQIFGIDQFFYNPENIPCEGGPTYMSDDLRDVIKLVQ